MSKTEIITVYSRGAGMEEALAATEQFGAASGLDRKNNLRLRLLGEELFGTMRGIVGDVRAQYWVQQEDGSFEIHLQSDVLMTPEMRTELLSLATRSEKESKSFLGKLLSMIGSVLIPSDEAASMLSVSFMSMGSPGGYRVGSDAFVWTLSYYKQGVESLKNGEGEEAWDELEKSIVVSIADDIAVRVRGTKVDIVIYKKF